MGSGLCVGRLVFDQPTLLELPGYSSVVAEVSPICVPSSVGVRVFYRVNMHCHLLGHGLAVLHELPT